MKRAFQIERSLHGGSNTMIQAHDFTLAECRVLRGIISNNYRDSDDYKSTREANPFVQGYQEPYDKNDGWVLIEFWSADRSKVQQAVDYINRVLDTRVAEYETE